MSGDDAPYEVALIKDDGSVEAVAVENGETILQAAERAGFDLPHGCREARCASCTGRLVAGDVEYITEPRALDEDRRSDGFVLVCSARPLSDCRIEVGPSVRADAYPGLWTG